MSFIMDDNDKSGSLIGLLGEWPGDIASNHRRYPIAIISTGIVANVPTIHGNIYDKAAIQIAIKEFNVASAKYGGIPGGILNRQHIGQIDKITHKTMELFLNDSDLLCARIKIIDKDLYSKLSDGHAMIARPIIVLPGYELEHKPMNVTNIVNIGRIHLEGLS